MLRRWITIACLACLSLDARAGQARDEAYFVAPVTGLSFVGTAKLPKHETLSEWRGGAARPYLGPYAVIEGPGEVFIAPAGERSNESFGLDAHQARIGIRLTSARAVRGKLFVPDESSTSALFFGDATGSAETPTPFVALEFEVGAEQFDAQRQDYLRARLAHDQRMLDLAAPGGAWWRMRVDDAERELNPEPAGEVPAPTATLRGVERWQRRDADDTFAMFTGGRALAENLQLDRMILPGPGGAAEIDVASLRGIDVEAFDWKPLLEGSAPELDPLARAIPEDQHAVFFPRFDAFVDVLEECERQGAQWYELAEPSSEDRAVRKRYERQLCLELDAVGKLLGAAVIREVALTGSDAFLRTGTDVALIFDSPSAATLLEFVQRAQDLALANPSGAVPVERSSGTFAGAAGGAEITWRAVTSRDDAIRSYVLRHDDLVVVSNSLPQLERVAQTLAGALPALASSDEYKFFRRRYPRGGDESALVVLSDATIRRWCGPRWRIGMARRTQAAAWLADLEARRLRALSRGEAPTRESLGHVGLKDFEFVGTQAHVHSQAWGSARFLRPILELDLTRATALERDAYERYRAAYQSRWSRFFDPIALRLIADERALEVDLTVMPLIDDTEYDDWRAWCGDVMLAGPSFRTADALGYFAVALDPDGRHLKDVASTLSSTSGASTNVSAGWVDGRAELYAPADPWWDELLAAEQSGDQNEFLTENYHRCPLVFVVPSKDPLRLAALLTAMRAASASAAPNLLTWETLDYKGISYVSIRPQKGAGGDFFDVDQVQLCYAALPEAWIVSLREDKLQQTLDGVLERRTGAQSATPMDWFGGSACLEFSPRLPLFLFGLGDEGFSEATVTRHYASLPILNELRREFPDQDPQRLYAEAFGAGTLASGVDGGAGFVWNETWGTFESKSHGSPAAPRQGPSLRSLFASIERIRLGLTFEHDGVRAKARLVRLPR